MALISVLVVNFNAREALGEALESLRLQTRVADEVIVVDNASADGSVAFVREHFPSVRIIESSTNAGFSGGNNVAADVARGDYLALLNSDAVADPNWLAELTSALDENPLVGAAVPKIYRGRSDRIEQVGAVFNNLANIWGRGFNEIDRGQYDQVVEVPALTACAALVRRDALQGEKLFDPTFFMYHEELDLSIRLRGRGYSIVFVPTARVYHKGMESMKKASRQADLSRQFYCNRNRSKILMKYYPALQLLRSLPLIALSFLYWNAVFLYRGGVGFCVRALAAQAAYSRQGLHERRNVSLNSGGWLAWMQDQGLRDILKVKTAYDA